MTVREAWAKGPKKSKRIPRAHFSDNTHDQHFDEDCEPKKLKRAPRPHFSDTHDQQILSFVEWCALNNISPKTGRRILKAPGAPVVTMLTSTRIGISIKSDRDWKASRARAPQVA
jgi:hypothetical protein